MIKPYLKSNTCYFSILFPCFLSILFCIPNGSFAQDTTATKVGLTIFKKFQRDSILKLTIETNTKLLITKKYKEEWQPLKIKFKDEKAKAQKWKAKVRTRGNIRKQVCYYPPLKIKFKKKWLLKNGMDSAYNDLKLVIGCKKGDFYGNLVLKEYLIYKLYEELTAVCFKTQLAQIEFIDTQGKWKPFTTYAFFIENEDEMATQHNAKCARPKRLRSKYFYADQLDKMAFFEYMIGNTDWSAITSHNVRILKCKDYPLPLPIAYDFDYAGFVDAPYAVHGEGIDLKEVTDRMYLGICREEGVLARQIPIFNKKKTAFYKIIKDFPYLSNKEKKSLISYLNEFYEVLNSPKRFKRNIVEACREKGR